MTPPSNDAFNFITVFVSIILGLAVTEILQGFKRLLISRRRVRLYAPALCWAFTTLLSLAQTWWAMFDLRNHAQWTFAMYSAVLLQTLILYSIAALALPDQPAGEEAAMRATYYEHARPFFVLSAAAAVASIIKELVLYGRMPTPVNLGFHLAFIFATGLAAATRRPWYHQILGPVALAIYAAYSVILFDVL